MIKKSYLGIFLCSIALTGCNEKELNALKTQNTNLEAVNTAIKGDTKELQSAMALLRNELSAANDKVSQLEEECRNLRKNLSQGEGQKALNEELEKELASALAKLSELSDAKFDLEERNLELIATLENEKSRNLSLRKSLEMLERRAKP